MKNAKILWIDLEMTGLSPQKDRILEVAAIATDWDFNEIATFESSVKVDEKVIEERMVGEFWETFSETRDALKAQNLQATKNSLEVEAELIEFIKENFAEEIANGEKPIVIQTILDGVLPKLIPLAITLFLYYLLAKKKRTPLFCIGLLLVLGIGLAFVGHVLGVKFWG